MHPALFVAIERAIAGLDGHLRWALLLPTHCSYAKSAALLCIAPDTLRTYVRRARQRVAASVIESEWRDPTTLATIDMYIDAVAIRMARRPRFAFLVVRWRIGAWATALAWSPWPRVVVPAFGALILAVVLGPDLRTLLGGATGIGGVEQAGSAVEPGERAAFTAVGRATMPTPSPPETADAAGSSTNALADVATGSPEVAPTGTGGGIDPTEGGLLLAGLATFQRAAEAPHAVVPVARAAGCGRCHGGPRRRHDTGGGPVGW